MNYLDCLYKILKFSKPLDKLEYCEIYCLEIIGGHFIIRLYKDDDNQYRDYLEYKKCMTGFRSPCTFTVSSVIPFYEKYMTDYEEKHIKKHEWISTKQLRKEKAKSILNKGFNKAWVDADGYFYICDKYNYPSKKSKELFKEFGGEENALNIYCEFGSSRDSEFNWWHSLDDFMEYFNKKAKDVPSSWATPKWEIKRKGFTSIAPDDRKVILRLPYFNIENELKDKPSWFVAKSWINLCNSRYIDLDCDEILDEIIKSYQDKILKQ